MTGKLVLLRGGGGPVNEFILARVIRASKKQPTLDTGSFQGRFRPILGSWFLESIRPGLLPQFEKMPLGNYRVALHDGRKIPVTHTKENFSTVIRLEGE